MKKHDLGLWIKIMLSILMALMLTILPLPKSLEWWQPAWLLMVLAFWIFAQPAYLGLGVIWCSGLYLDLLTGSPLGQHTIPLLIVCYLLIKFNARLRIFPFLRQLLMMLSLIVIYYVVQYQLVRLVRPMEWNYQLFYPVLSTTFLWIVIFKLLKNYEYRLRKW